jgi:cysteine-rich repeat protein
VNCMIDPKWTCTGGTPTSPDVCNPICGNIRNGNEECDDGNTNNGDGCSSSCIIEPGFLCTSFLNFPSVCTAEICGDGKRSEGEGCDDSNTTQNLYSPALDKGCIGCVVKPFWNCGGGSATTPDVCVPICGDGNVVTPVEECDDGNQVAGDGCSI